MIKNKCLFQLKFVMGMVGFDFQLFSVGQDLEVGLYVWPDLLGFGSFEFGQDPHIAIEFQN
jgi:hypothetical protein